MAVRSRRGSSLARLALGTILVGACSTTPTVAPTADPSASPTSSPTSSPAFARGGTLRLVVPSNFDTDVMRTLEMASLEPQRSFFSAFLIVALFRCCLYRTLVSHNGLSVEEGGARLHPDLVESLPEVSPDGLTWIFHLKRGLHYGPPLQDIEITSHDFVRAFHRMFLPDVGAGFDFEDIAGAVDFGQGEAASISGLEAPDASTLIIHLTQAQGDFGARLVEWFAAPLPPDPEHLTAPMAGEQPDESMWRYLAASGPYMFEGTDQVDLSAPLEQRRLPSGVGPGRIVLVRNPSWDPATDPLRPAYADRIEIELVDSMEAAVARIDDGTADVILNSRAPPTIPADVFAAFQADPSRGTARFNEYSGIRGLIMNVALPPFDDVHVRRAMNWVIDKAALVEIEGGPAAARPYGHIAPDVFLDGLLLDYDPFATPASRGDLVKAKAEMARSPYDGDGDGRCDAAACARIAALTRDQFAAVAQSAANDLAQIGLDLDIQVWEPNPFFESYADAAAGHGLWLGLGFSNAYVGATQWLTSFSGRRSISAEGGNGTMVGATREQLQRWGYEVTDVPNLDARIEACIPLIGAAQFQCWAAVDQYLMESVVPWVPYSQDRFAYITGPRVVHTGFDELASIISFDQFALTP